MSNQFYEKLSFFIGLIWTAIKPPFRSFKKIETYCKQRIKKAPQAGVPRLALAQLYAEFGMHEEAREEYQQLFHMGLLTDKDKIRFSSVFLDLDDFGGVVEILSDVSTDKRSMVTYYRNLGKAYNGMKDFNKSTAHFEKLFKAGTMEISDYIYFGYGLSKINKYDRAIEMYKKVLQMDSGSKNINKDKIKNNIKVFHLNKAIDLPDERIDDAEHEIEKALEIDPSDEKAKRMLEKIKAIKTRKTKDR